MPGGGCEVVGGASAEERQALLVFCVCEGPVEEGDDADGALRATYEPIETTHGLGVLYVWQLPTANNQLLVICGTAGSLETS